MVHTKSIENISISLQGNNFTLLVMNIHTTCIKKIKLDLIKKIQETPHFFTNKTPIVINVSNIDYKINWFNLYNTILDVGLYIIGVCYCYDNKLKNIIINSGIPILQPGNIAKNKKIHQSQISDSKKNNTITVRPKTQIIHNPIRSGQKFYARNTDLIVTANISSGAEVISDGNIHIYGTARGRILAGASGDTQSQIFCTNLLSELISINGYYWLNDQIPKEFLGKPVRIYLNKNTLIIKHIL